MKSTNYGRHSFTLNPLLYNNALFTITQQARILENVLVNPDVVEKLVA